MTMFETVLTMLLAMQPFHKDRETYEERVARMTIVASSITQAVEETTCTGSAAKAECKPRFKGSPEELAVGLLTIAKFETRLAQHIHEGNCGPRECDGGRAKSLFQVHVPQDLWEQIEGTSLEATLQSARIAATMWSRMWQCRSLDRAFAGYMTSYCQTTRQGSIRAQDYLVNLAKYRRLKG